MIRQNLKKKYHNETHNKEPTNRVWYFLKEIVAINLMALFRLVCTIFNIIWFYEKYTGEKRVSNSTCPSYSRMTKHSFQYNLVILYLKYALEVKYVILYYFFLYFMISYHCFSIENGMKSNRIRRDGMIRWKNKYIHMKQLIVL